jgi:hypothetical protein
MLRFVVYAMLPGLASSVLKRYTQYNLHTMVLSQVTHLDAKYWIQKYFDANDFVVERAVSVFKSDKKD